jgi:peptide/nickel transport system substrate-binding protein
VLSERYGLLLDALAKLESSNCFIMRRKEAETDPAQQVRETIGSGPFLFNRDETRPGNRYVYDRNPNYRPRGEPAQTALSALQAGEIDFYEVPPQDLVEQLEQDPNLVVQVLNKSGDIGHMRLNHLHPPFDNVDARRAMLHLVRQDDVMRAIFGPSKYWRTCASYFACGSAMENDANTDWFKAGPDVARARELFRKAGYDGRPVVLLQGTDFYFANSPILLIAQWLREAGVNAEVAASDWGGVLTRRAVKKPPAEGGWNIFTTTSSGWTFSGPVNFSGHTATGESAWFGWPKNELHEKLRDQWAAAGTLDERKEIARQIQRNAWDYVHYVALGQFFRASAWRKNVRGLIGMPILFPFWNVEKIA